MLHCTKHESAGTLNLSGASMDVVSHRRVGREDPVSQDTTQGRTRSSITPHDISFRRDYGNGEREISGASPQIIMDRYSALDGLLAAFDDGSLEAAGILTDLVTPPSFAEDDSCSICQQTFSVVCFRHHCRHCGELLLQRYVAILSDMSVSCPCLCREILLPRAFKLLSANLQVRIHR